MNLRKYVIQILFDRSQLISLSKVCKIMNYSFKNKPTKTDGESVGLGPQSSLLGEEK